ncbi:glycoside hydrolase family 99-like domain-containing protein, partial [Hyphomonas sp.]|uniref:glycoside hydrolase family 99-like domain-containing protein n=1 Tax=Hyphomonas sp. TaxID=87 RepID=UPI00391B404B
MQDRPAGAGAIMLVRRYVSQFFWSAWKALPLSDQQRQQAIDTLFRRAPFAVSWTKSYALWQAEQQRQAEQLAQMLEIQQRRQELQGDEQHGKETSAAAHARYEELTALPRPAALKARAIAFYLPQFHPIPENDRWWGNGFTEWTNVRRARPLFEGHRQPRRPGELGHYDLLRNPEIRRRQAALAHQHGLEGFCFYYYWFGGRRLLEQPVDAYAGDEAARLPFCLCWANESWSRRWDGREDQLLIGQYHSAEDDIAFIASLARYLASEKYIRVGGQPLVILYRPDLLPDAKATAERWRGWCRENGIGEIFLAYTLSFASGSPDEYGFDAAIEFPPNNMGLSPRDNLVVPTGTEFAAKVYDLIDLPLESTPYQRPSFRLFRGVTPQWDNTARRMGNAAVMLDAGPSVYEQWLRAAADDMAKRETLPDERLVFINAWNEWAEGAYLEPDTDYGYAWLNATRRALADGDSAETGTAAPDTKAEPREKILLVTHDLNRNGAQMLSLHLSRIWSRTFGFEVTTIACDDGPLKANFEAYGQLLICPKSSAGSRDFARTLTRLHEDGFTRAVVNSCAGGWITPHLARAGIESIGLLHELPEVIRQMKLEDGILGFEAHCRHVIFASDFIRERTETDSLGQAWPRPVILPQGLFKAETILSVDEKEAARAAVRARLSLPEDAEIILGMGYGDARKAPDIFCSWAVEAARQNPRLYFVWIGDLTPDMRTACHAILANAGALADHVRMLTYQSSTGDFNKAATAYALSSREDPYPSSLLEALACGTPAFIVSGRTGLTALSRHPSVIELPDDDPAGFAAALTRFIKSRPRRARAEQAAADLIRSEYGFQSYAGDLLRLAGAHAPRISVIVPNYNYARYLPQRIATLLNQRLPVWEIIFLDDASTDDSLEVAARLLKDCGINYRIVPNTENSGSVFAQWQKGVKLARGDIVWIAEADDWAGADFTRAAAAAFADEDVVLSYTQSQMVSEDSEILAPDYLAYVADISPDQWRSAYVRDGAEELACGLSVKNTIPNVSGALFRREAL